MAITIQLNTVTSQLAKIHKENQQGRCNLHDLSSRVANESATNEDIRLLQSALRDRSHRVLAPTHAAAPTAPQPHLNVSL